MRTLGRFLGRLAFRGSLWLLWAPVVFTINLVRLWMARWLLRDSIVCPTCRAKLSLLGLWECGACAYTFYGFYFARCAACGSVPPYLTCTQCGASSLHPLG